MSFRRVIMISVPYMLIMFLAERFFINPERGIRHNILSTLVSGIIFIIVVPLVYKLVRK